MNDLIQKDDEKMDELIFLQTVSEGDPKYSSIEEKYEDELLFQEIERIVNKNRKDVPEFFDDEEDEQ